MEAGGIGVLHVISGLGLGGAERMLLWSARHRDRSRFRMGVVSLMSGGELADEIRGEGVEVHELGEAKGRFSPGTLVRILSIARRFEPAILQGHMFHSNILVRMLGVRQRRAAVLSTRHSDREGPARRIANALTALLNDGTIVFSRRALEAERRESPFSRPLRLIRYGVEVPPAPAESGRQQARKDLGIPGESFLWAAVGRLDREKGFDLLIEAFSLLGERSSALLLVGEGPEKEDLAALALQRGVAHRVVFTGARTDVPRLMAAADAFVLSSRWEAGPLVVLEAMGAGLPVVATRVGDAGEMVQEGRTGVLVDPGSPRGLSDAMARLMAMGNELRNWGLRGRRRVEELYDFRRVQREMEEYYLRFAAEGRGEAGSWT